MAGTKKTISDAKTIVVQNPAIAQNINTSQKVALVVGASSGIGHHAALQLLSRGYRVYNASRTESKDNRIKNIILDVTKTASIDLCVKEFFEKENRIDLLVYSAGYSMAAPVEHVKMKDVYTLFETNYFGAVKIVQKFLPSMRERNSGRIVLISSIAADTPVAFDSYYSSSKAALDMLVRGLNIELEPYNIKAISVQPGGTSTRFSYKRNVYDTQKVGDYADRMAYSVKETEKTEQNGMRPDSVAETIINVIESPNPPQIAVCGLKNKTYKLVQKLLPDRINAYLMKSQYIDRANQNSQNDYNS